MCKALFIQFPLDFNSDFLCFLVDFDHHGQKIQKITSIVLALLHVVSHCAAVIKSALLPSQLIRFGSSIRSPH